MKDINGKIQYKDKEYTLVFNFNVMEKMQEEYGSFEEWGRYSSGEYLAKQKYDKLGKKKQWYELTDEEKAKYESGEPDIHAVIFAIKEALNEGIDIENEDKGTNIPPLTFKQVGRIVTEIGYQKATATLHQLVANSTKSEEKNE